MVPSEELELSIFHFAESAGKARWRATDFGTLSNVVQLVEDAVLVDALRDLHGRAFMEFRRWSDDCKDWVLYRSGTDEYFSRPFQMRVTFSGRKYFETLEAQPKDLGRSRVDPVAQIRLHDIADTGKFQGQRNSTPQPIYVPKSTPPKAFVSHATQDRPFVEARQKKSWVDSGSGSLPSE